MKTTKVLFGCVLFLSLSLFSANISWAGWNATLTAKGEDCGGVNEYSVIIGVDTEAESLPAPPAPPKYCVKMDLNKLDWTGMLYKDIRQDGKTSYMWVIGIDPHGNVKPPPSLTATVSWNPSQFGPGKYELREGYDGTGAVVISDMKTTMSYEVTGVQAVKYFTVGYLNGGMTLNLHEGFNLISSPSNIEAIPDAYTLLEAIDNSGTKVRSIEKYDKTADRVRKAFYKGDGTKGGDNFKIIAGEGLVAYAEEDMNVEMSQANCPVYDLKAGENWVGTPCEPTHSSAFKLLQAIGDENVVISIQRFNVSTGKFETALYEDGIPSGTDFSIKAGEGYFIFMKQNLTAIQP